MASFNIASVSTRDTNIIPRALLEGLYWLWVDTVFDIEKAISYTLYYIHIPQVDVFFI